MKFNAHYLGIDYGTKRWGLSYADELGIATPLPAIVSGEFNSRIEQLKKIIAARKITHLVVGYPVDPEERAGERAKEVDAFVAQLEKALALPVLKSDERWTTQDARSDAAAVGLTKKRKRGPCPTRKKGTNDSRAATLMLQYFLGNPLFLDESLDEIF